MPRTLALLVSSLLLVAGVLTACGGSEESQPASPSPGHQTSKPAAGATSTTPAQPAGPQIVISKNAFTVPPSVTPGQQITIVNKDEANHSVTSNDNNLFDVRVSGGGGETTLTAPNAPGSYVFHCKYHANMSGTLTVQ